MLYSARSKEFVTEEGQQKAVDTCQPAGHRRHRRSSAATAPSAALQALSHHGINVVGIPGTIDNDIGCSDYTIGFDTAANTAVENIDKLRDTMQSHERCSVVEVMGRTAGHLALYVGLATGATAVLVPERPVNFEAGHHRARFRTPGLPAAPIT